MFVIIKKMYHLKAKIDDGLSISKYEIRENKNKSLKVKSRVFDNNLYISVNFNDIAGFIYVPERKLYLHFEISIEYDERFLMAIGKIISSVCRGRRFKKDENAYFMIDYLRDRGILKYVKETPNDDIMIVLLAFKANQQPQRVIVDDDFIKKYELGDELDEDDCKHHIHGKCTCGLNICDYINGFNHLPLYEN
jgi:hypothetical protein